jgi:putative phosphoribosyl transferase
MTFPDRKEAGCELVKSLSRYADRPDVIVVGVPRGGIPVAFEVATKLNVPLDVILLRKLGVPYQEELAFGAVASGGVRVLDQEIVEAAQISDSEIELIAARERKELERRERAYRGERLPLDVRGKTVIVVDDGIATGSSIRAGIRALRKMNPARLVIAVPVAPASTCRRLEHEVDELVCLQAPSSFVAIGVFYDDFSQVSDKEVTDLLHRSMRPPTQSLV